MSAGQAVVKLERLFGTSFNWSVVLYVGNDFLDSTVTVTRRGALRWARRRLAWEAEHGGPPEQVLLSPP